MAGGAAAGDKRRSGARGGVRLRDMKEATLVPIEEYLRTTYRPDCDYVDGEVIERNLGERDRSKLQGELFYYLRTRARQWGIHIYPEQRVQISTRRFRVPDLCIVAGSEPRKFSRAPKHRGTRASSLPFRGFPFITDPARWPPRLLH